MRNRGYDRTTSRIFDVTSHRIACYRCDDIAILAALAGNSFGRQFQIDVSSAENRRPTMTSDTAAYTERNAMKTTLPTRLALTLVFALIHAFGAASAQAVCNVPLGGA